MNEIDNSLEVFCVVSAIAKTGVEMEAIMGVNAALITIYDLSKIVNPHLKIDNVKLLIKRVAKVDYGLIQMVYLIFLKICFNMKIKLELFGASKDLSDKEFLEIDLKKNSSIKDLRNELLFM